MPVSDEMILRAARLDRRAAEELLTQIYPAIWRIAHGLTGTSQSARKVVDTVFSVSLRVMPGWGKGLMAENWFYHHTLLNSRVEAAHPPPAREDLLVVDSENVTPEYVAFISALRKLPFQQREAFLLHHGEHFNERMLGIAMDSSISAARLHLRAATEALDAVTGGATAALAAQMVAAYAKLDPTEKTVVPYIRTKVGRAIWRRRIRRLIRRTIFLAILGGLAYLGWKYRAQLVQAYQDWRNTDSTPATPPTK